MSWQDLTMIILVLDISTWVGCVVAFLALGKVGKKSYGVSLPIEIIRVLGWKKGSQLLVRRHGKKIEIEKVED